MRAVWMTMAVLAVVVSGCKKDGEAAKAPVAAAPAAAPTGTKAAALAPGSDGMLHGKLAERIDAPNYTYLRLTDGAAEAWAAVPTTTLAVGTDVVVTNPQPMPGFQSKTLNRTWELIYFGGGAAAAGAAPAAEANAAPSAAPSMVPAGHPNSAPVDLGAIKVGKADGPNAKTVAELFAQKASLKDQTVSVRGKVVKVTSGVLGKTWLHLRDGSGSDATSDNDITVTTTATVAMNDELTISGAVHLDRDLGAGYTYPVIIEDATVSK